ncbi:MAG: hypothetical protein Q8Q12_15860 [bacterium]|nr:hypothetical protein [bacterium]
MRRKKQNGSQQPSAPFDPKYAKPKVLLIDLPAAALDLLHRAGFNAFWGTFGSPYKVPLGDLYRRAAVSPSLPSYSEQEIIMIDLTPPTTIGPPQEEHRTHETEFDWWGKCSRGEIDPRPAIMREVRDDFDRILRHGGLFVVFAQPRSTPNLVRARVQHGQLDTRDDVRPDNWSFLSILSPRDLEITSDIGEEIEVPEEDYELFRFLRTAIPGATYTATFKLACYDAREHWTPLCWNKFGQCVGGLFKPEDSKGRLLIFPQLSRKAESVVHFLREVLPEISPHLFPHIEGPRWVQRDEYELDTVRQYKAEKLKVHEKAKGDLDQLDTKIAGEREKLGFLHGIITGTDRDLVTAVKACLEHLGFKDVVDVDEEAPKQAPGRRRQEDLQIRDRSPVLLLEVKGLSGLPRESDTIQVQKYVQRRMKEWDRTDVRAVCIINHQRNLPALDRDNKNVFTDQQIEDAAINDITILTAWDLFLLFGGMTRWGWGPKSIQELLYHPGRMPRFPSIYEPIGEISHYWDDISVVSVQIQGGLRRGQRVGYVTPRGFLEETVLSLQVDNQDVEEALPGVKAGMKTGYARDLLPNGTTVCVVTHAKECGSMVSGR